MVHASLRQRIRHSADRFLENIAKPARGDRTDKPSLLLITAPCGAKHNRLIGCHGPRAKPAHEENLAQYRKKCLQCEVALSLRALELSTARSNHLEIATAPQTTRPTRWPSRRQSRGLLAAGDSAAHRDQDAPRSPDKVARGKADGGRPRAIPHQKKPAVRQEPLRRNRADNVNTLDVLCKQVDDICWDLARHEPSRFCAKRPTPATANGGRTSITPGSRPCTRRLRGRSSGSRVCPKLTERRARRAGFSNSASRAAHPAGIARL
jgi:hypothetical protein